MNMVDEIVSSFSLTHHAILIDLKNFLLDLQSHIESPCEDVKTHFDGVWPSSSCKYLEHFPG